MKALLDAGADKESVVVDTTPLCLASENGRIEVVRLLLEAGADKDADHGTNYKRPSVKIPNRVHEGGEWHSLRGHA